MNEPVIYVHAYGEFYYNQLAASPHFVHNDLCVIRKFIYRLADKSIKSILNY